MEMEALHTKFYELVAPSLPNEWDVEEALSHLVTGDGEHLDDIFAQIPAIWPVSHSLCFAYLAAANSVLNSLEVENLSLLAFPKHCQSASFADILERDEEYDA